MYRMWHSVSIRVVEEVRDAWFWLFWHQYNIYEFLCSNRPKIVTLGWRRERVTEGIRGIQCCSPDLDVIRCIKKWCLKSIETYLPKRCLIREGRKPGVFMNPRVTHKYCFLAWRERIELHIKHTTLEPKFNQLFLNLGHVSHECR